MPSPKKLLFIVDGSLDRPLLHSQGLPLLRRLADLGVGCFIQSFEQDKNVLQSPLGQELEARGIQWRPVVQPGGKDGVERIEMIFKGFWNAFKLCRSEKIDVVHCRSYRPAVIGSMLKSLTQVGFLFDMRGFLIDEQIMLGRWNARGVKYRIARWLERHCLLHADAIVTTSPQFSQRVSKIEYIEKSNQKAYIISIPNCVDSQRFNVSQQARELYRQKMAWEKRVVVAFAGEARTWESFESIITTFQTLKRHEPTAFLALYAYGKLDALQHQLEAQGLAQEDYLLTAVPPSEMPVYLASSDIGIVFRKDNPFTQEIASPIKFAEYLACGLLVMINPGVGDTARIVNQYRVGVILDPENYQQVEEKSRQLIDWLHHDPEIRTRCRQAAQSELSLDLAVQEYLHVYEMILMRRK